MNIDSKSLATRGPSRRILWFAAGALSAMYAILSFHRHWQFQSGLFDLGIYVQGIWKLSRFEWPKISLIQGNNIMADHFEPALLIIAPLFRLWPQPELLLAIQALAVGLSIIPIHSFCRRRLPEFESGCLAAAYGLFWGVQLAVVYDFHGILLALPLLALTLNAFDQMQRRKLAIFLTLLLFLREDMGLLVAGIGLGCWARGQRQFGIFACIAGLSWTWFTISWLMPYLGGDSNYRHWMYQDLGSGPLQVLGHLLLHPWQMLTLFMDDPVKRSTLFMLFVPFLGLCFLSPYLLLGLPLLAARFWSDNTVIWGTGFHHNALIAVILVVATADGIYRLQNRTKQWKRRWSVVITAFIFVQALARIPSLPLRALALADFYSPNSVSLEVRQYLAEIPQNKSVVAQQKLGVYLAQRPQVSVLNQTCPDADLVFAWGRISIEPFRDHANLRSCIEQKLKNGYRRIPAPHELIVLSRQ